MNHKISNSKRYRYIFEKYICDSSMNIQIWIQKLQWDCSYWNNLRYMQKKIIFFSPEMSSSFL